MTRPRVGFLGVGWIGFDRMEAMLGSGLVEGVAICDPSPEMRAKAAARLPSAAVFETLEAMLQHPLEGVAIATPSALHAAQAIRCLEVGKAVFCQKPLARDARETRDVVEAAARADRLLRVDYSYRYCAATSAIADLVRRGDLGQVFAIDLTFHNAYGPDKAWFYDRAQSGGGCLMDLGIHLVDLALWVTGTREVEIVSAALYRGGAPMTDAGAAEDYALASFTLSSGTAVRLACSWRLHAGRMARIEADFFGTAGGASLRNVDGSFYDFSGDHLVGTSTKPLCEPPDAWSGRAAQDWCRRLSDNAGFEPEATSLADVAAVLDGIYAAHFSRVG